MSGYARAGRERRRARPLYLELCALGLELWVEDDPDEPLSFRVLVSGSAPSPRPTPTGWSAACGRTRWGSPGYSSPGLGPRTWRRSARKGARVDRGSPGGVRGQRR